MKQNNLLEFFGRVDGLIVVTNRLYMRASGRTYIKKSGRIYIPLKKWTSHHHTDGSGAEWLIFTLQIHSDILLTDSGSNTARKFYNNTPLRNTPRQKIRTNCHITQ